MKINYRILDCIFIIFYLFIGVFFGVIWSYITIYIIGFRIELKHFLNHFLVAIPIILAILGLIFFIKKRKVNIFLWGSSLYWLFYIIHKLLGIGRLKMKVFFLFTATVSVACIFYLIIASRITGRSAQGTEPTKEVWMRYSGGNRYSRQHWWSRSVSKVLYR